MRISIFGTGYVGLVTGACLAEAGNHVVCVDIDGDKVERLNAGEVPIHEPGLEELVQRNHSAGRLSFTTRAQEAVAHGKVQFIAVGTPPAPDGDADISSVVAVARAIGEHMEAPRIIVDKSTVPVGTADNVHAAVQQALDAREVTLDFDVVSNPEFLKEGGAVNDFMKPDRIIIGSRRADSTDIVKRLYAPFNRNHDKILVMDVRSAELTKYAANAMLATKISFMNEMANIAERVGADIERVRVGIGSDPRIGFDFIYPGAGYGGSCFPKDVQALNRTAAGAGYEPRILSAVQAVNDEQKGLLFRKIRYHFGEDLAGLTIGLWGLAFKPRTDDMREAPSRVLMESLWQAGARVRAYDPEAAAAARALYPDRDELLLCDTPEAAVDGADALVLMTEWKHLWSPDFDAIKRALRQPVIFDGRNIYDERELREAGFVYYGIGRGERWLSDTPHTPAHTRS